MVLFCVVECQLVMINIKNESFSSPLYQFPPKCVINWDIISVNSLTLKTLSRVNFDSSQKNCCALSGLNKALSTSRILQFRFFWPTVMQNYHSLFLSSPESFRSNYVPSSQHLKLSKILMAT